MEEGLMLTLGWSDARHEPLILRSTVQVDMAQPMPSPMLTTAEMQLVAFAAKMALLRVLRQRKAKKRTP